MIFVYPLAFAASMGEMEAAILAGFLTEIIMVKKSAASVTAATLMVLIQSQPSGAMNQPNKVPRSRPMGAPMRNMVMPSLLTSFLSCLGVAPRVRSWPN